MPAYFAVVLIPTQSSATVRDAVARALAPYDQNIPAPEWEARCACVGRRARKESAAKAAHDLGDMDSFRHRFVALHKIEGKDGTNITPEEDERISGLWAEHIRPLCDAEEGLLQLHPLKDSPRPECRDCEGTGKIKSTLNPNGLWDNWGIGGRFSGWLGDVKPDTFPENLERCDNCGGRGRMRAGKGMREMLATLLSSQVMQAAGDIEQCSYCAGRGKRLRCAPELRDEGNVVPTEVAMRLPIFRLPTLIVAGGSVRSNIEIDRFGTVTAKDPDLEWARAARAIFAANLHSLAVGVDCHT